MQEEYVRESDNKLTGNKTGCAKRSGLHLSINV